MKKWTIDATLHLYSKWYTNDPDVKHADYILDPPYNTQYSTSQIVYKLSRICTRFASMKAVGYVPDAESA